MFLSIARTVGLVRGLGTMTSLSSTVLFLIFDLVGIGETASRSFPWQVITILSLLIFMGFVFATVYKYQKVIDFYEKRRPSMEVSPRIEKHESGDLAYLDIENIGDIEGVFTARLENLVGLDEQIPNYYVRWLENEADSRSMSIDKDGKATLEIAKADSIMRKTREVNGDTEDYSVQIVTTQASHRIWQANMNIGDTMTFSLRITTTPAMKDPFVRRYRLVNGGNNSWESFEEIP